jgi:hypothetical protein
MISTGMQKRAGILFISKKTSRIFLILEDSKWTVPTFVRNTSVFDDSKEVILNLVGKESRLIPVELYQSQDMGFEYSTFMCLVDEEFFGNSDLTICWSNLVNLPKNLHTGLKSTLTNKITQTKIETVLIMENAV